MTAPLREIDPAAIGRAFADRRAYARRAVDGPPVHLRIGPSRLQRVTSVAAFAIAGVCVILFGIVPAVRAWL